MKVYNNACGFSGNKPVTFFDLNPIGLFKEEEHSTSLSTTLILIPL